MLVLVESCTPEETVKINQDKIFTEYEALYLENKDETVVRARFKYKNSYGRTLQLSTPSEVLFNGEKLEYNEAFQHYEKVYEGLIESGQFQWKNTMGVVFNNAIDIEPVGLSPVDTIYGNPAYEISWIGEPLGNNESMTLLLTDIDKAETEIIRNEEPYASVIEFSDTWENLLPGFVSLTLERTTNHPVLESPEAGGSLTGRYRTNPVVSFIK